MRNITLLLFSAIASVFLLFPSGVGAESSSVGISPARITINNLLPGLSTKREIVISRSDTTQSQVFVITTDNSESSRWLSFTPGTEVVIPQGQNRVSIWVNVTVPSGATYKRYTTNIRVVGKSELTNNQVNIQTGVITSIELVVTDQQVTSIKVVSARIADFASNSSLKLSLRLQNDGNVPTAPSKIKITIYDSRGRELTSLEKTDVAAIQALTTSEQEISFEGANLSVGDYLAKLVVYDVEGLAIYSYDLSFKVLEPGAVTTDNTEAGIFTNAAFYYGLIGFGVLLTAVALFKIFKSRSNKV